ncbi:hypothetical protein CL176_09625 [Suicoccus acidiformans]|uniref:ABC-2 transporter permease n=1 Tax=Suicoccus acidiformans TaxID=2036206 RepID=A0A347WMC7_9LACT|nr:ABC-2 transporter permease [Suicoccus acidiformans]AXY26234.1 hypothetical protein CL176_09625 [Suicoccus acidiformans]
MRALLNKEFIVNRKTQLLSLLIYLIISFLLNEGGLSLWMAPVFTIKRLDIHERSDEKNESWQLINSLPVSRTQVLQSKFLFNFITSCVYILIPALINYLVPSFETTSLSTILLYLSLCAVLITVYHLLYLLFGPKVVGVVFILLFGFIIGAGPAILESSLAQNILTSLSSRSATSIQLLVSAILLAISAGVFSITLSRFKKMDL